MSYTSGFFDAVEVNGEYDRVYEAAEFAHYFSRFIRNGVYADPSTGMQVRASSNPNMKVSVLPGDGWINGYYITVDAAEQLSIATAHATLARIDSVVMGLNYTTRMIQIYIKTGTPSGSPVAPVLQRDTDLWELELAQISVVAGAANITQSAITDSRTDLSRCGIVTGLIDQIDTTDLFAQYTTAFNEWFDGVREKLTEDAAGYLESQIELNKSIRIELTLVASNWSNKLQTVTNSNLIPTGYAYIVGPIYDSKTAFDRAKIEAKDVTVSGKMTFTCAKVPTASLTVQVLRVKV